MLLGAVTAASFGGVDFKKQIEPIFEAHCLKCHGPDKQKGGVRLTGRAYAIRDADSGHAALVPSDADGSSLYQRIISKNKDERMPPKGERLNAQQVQLIRQWIDAGAPWPGGEEPPRHWAYLRPKRSPLPKVQKSEWVRNPVDRFILAKLEKKGLTPAPTASKAKLLRRLSLDLTGLPPTPEQVKAFENDDNPNAYEKWVDRFLASPRYGEKWARQWLDLARYADSNGFQADQIRESWAYRDWVIGAFNQDKPFDQFTIEQLAGDLLPDAAVDHRIATGFHRTVTCNVEAGVHPEENRTNQVVDRVNTTGTVWLGTTIECAQCHNHKYDPFSQKEYYQLFAFFNNTPIEVKQQKGVTFDFYGPKMSLPLDPSAATKRRALQERYDALKKQLGDRKAVSRRQWEKDLKKAIRSGLNWKTAKVVSVQTTGGEDHTVLDNGSVLFSGNLPGTTTYTLQTEVAANRVTAIRLEALTHPSIPGKGPGRGDAKRTNFVLNDFSVTHQGRPVKLLSASADYSQKNWPVAGAIDGKAKTGWAIAPQFGKPHWAVFELAKPIEADKGRPLRLTFTLDQNFGRGRTLGNIRLSVIETDPDAALLPEPVVAALQKARRSKKEKKLLIEAYRKATGAGGAVRKKLEDLKRQIDKIDPPTTLVMVEMAKARPTRIMKRGDYLNTGMKVEPMTPAALNPWKPAWPKNRLGLARWLVDPANPLTARVAVNRWWAQLMGRAIVETQEDFGTQSEPPSHPELLDWLAVEFMSPSTKNARPWSIKHLHKTIVMSAAYRQSSAWRPNVAEQDPTNRLYHRGPRVRLSAETIRDNALAISGLLSTRLGGPPVMPYQPSGVWRAVGRNQPKWVAARNEDRFRRGIYVIWKRAAPYPSFKNFDAPDRTACTPYRARTNTPLQALTLMNDQAYVEAAVAMAVRIMTESKSETAEDRVAYAFRLVVARAPKPAERDLLLKAYRAARARYDQDPKSAQTLLKNVRGYRVPQQLDAI
ncbi:MAG: PSD1 and planctomycete cytochrome C domain-containing protein, partial [Phycisphaeraceae bacterium]|nr:PSD1 and planctomycete cytochrome C domain-containing protein [Phycisphaeraceae bacterium]